MSHPAAMLGVVGAWPAGEVLGLDFETTGIDRFNDVPVSYALVSVVEGVVVRSWSGLIDPGRPIPAEATEVHGISTEQARDEGMPLGEAVALVSDAVVAASESRCAAGRYETRLRPDHSGDPGAATCAGMVSSSGAGVGPCSTQS